MASTQNQPPELRPEFAELIAVLLEELPLIDEVLERHLMAWMSDEASPEERQETAENLRDYFDRFGEALESMGFTGFQRVVRQVRENLDQLTARAQLYGPEEAELLAAWSTHASLYLENLYQPEACADLIAWLREPAWPQPLAQDQAQALEQALLEPTLALEDSGSQEMASPPPRPRESTPEDLSLALPEDVNPELLEALLKELPEQSRALTEAITHLSTDRGTLEDLHLAQRMAHTLKGASNTVGVVGIANLAHQLEDILTALSKEKRLPTPALAQSLLNGADCLEAMGEALTGVGEPPEDAQAVFQEILDWANRIDQEGLPEGGKAPSEPEPSAPSPSPAERASDPKPSGGSPSTPLAPDLVDRLLRQGGETLIQSAQIYEQVRRMGEQMRTMKQELQRLQRLGDDLERLIDLNDLNAHVKIVGPADTEFDPLELDQYNELHTTSRMLVEAATDIRQIGESVGEQLRHLDAMLLVQERLHRETQEAILGARMVPVSTIAPRLQRITRQACRMTGKQADLILTGAETLMDHTVLQELLQSLMHILRNAVDHGIEPPDQRVQVGKPPTGRITLDFRREGNHIRVRCQDDGRGIDYDAIRRVAEQRGLLKPEQRMTEEALQNFLLAPNFSTRSEITQTSGRGVGLDVVYSHILAQGGSLRLDSEPNRGTVIELRLPVSFISTHALLIRVHHRILGIADRGIERIIHPADAEPHLLGGREVLQVGEHYYPIRPLDEILPLPPAQEPADAPMAAPILLVRDRTGLTAIPVQEILSGIDLVIKEFGRYVPRAPGILGATILGDGTVTPVLDLPELMNDAQALRTRGSAEPAATPSEEIGPPQPQVLVVDDSLSARRALVQVMEDAGYVVEEAHDGIEAIQAVEHRRPALILTDLEMPRMNGIELAMHLRAHPETAQIPLIMITSRSTEKHRKRALAAGVDAYLIKPFSEDQLLEQVERFQNR